jgi:hypothetical protein
MKEGDVEVGVIGQQVENVVTLAPNGHIEEGIQANVEVGETSSTTNVSVIEVEM